jgi:hypothetical protein
MHYKANINASHDNMSLKKLKSYLRNREGMDCRDAIYDRPFAVSKTVEKVNIVKTHLSRTQYYNIETKMP